MDDQWHYGIRSSAGTSSSSNTGEEFAAEGTWNVVLFVVCLAQVPVGQRAVVDCSGARVAQGADWHYYN